MYFGSVKFFKHLIYTVVIAWFTVFTFGAVFFGIKYFSEKKHSKELAEQLASSQYDDAGDKASLTDHYFRMVWDGYSPEDVLAFLDENENDAFQAYVKEKYPAPAPADTPDDSGSGNDGEPQTHDPEDSTAIEYTSLYPDLYAEAPAEQIVKENTIYLTFDDGPSKNTLDILDILDGYDIKATFFMSAGNDEYTQEIMREVAKRGHSIGVHSISHEYNKIYESVEAFLDDMNETYSSIYEATGVKPQMIRFAGGSINNYNRLIYNQLIAEVTRRGFVYYDWNVSGEDATSHATWTSIYNNVINGVKESSSGRAIVLLHDAPDKELTVKTVEDIIDAMLAKGYTFEPLDHTVKPITFSYPD